ncbi:hypothetical protein [Pseudomonas sp. CFBP13528]|nr:hypothetical protein [Pseudomonas sp. CFBP13528]
MPSISPTNVPNNLPVFAEGQASRSGESSGIKRRVTEGDVNGSLSASLPGSSGKGSGIHEDVAARQIVKAFRGFISGKCRERMIHNGAIWKATAAGTEKSHIDDLSRSNLHTLRKELGGLSAQESSFLQNFFKVPLYATHSTAAPVKRDDDSVALFSRQKLIDRHIIFNTENSPQEDIKLLGNDDFVFFALEAGSEPKKPSSRFGGTTYRFDFDATAFKESAWLSLVEMRFAKTPNLDRHIDGLNSTEYANLSKRTLQPFETVFSGGDMKAGIGLSLIRDLRKLSPTTNHRLLSCTGEVEINKLINGLYRPEIKVARHFFSNNYMEAAVRKDDKA